MGTNSFAEPKDADGGHSIQVRGNSSVDSACSSSFEVVAGTEKLRSPSGSRLKVLIAEDNKVNQIIIHRMLQSLDIEADLADNGEEAVALAQRKDYDLILMDFQMPIMDGLDATRTLRRMGILTPTIGLSANTDEQSRRDAKEAGMVRYVVKPMRSYSLRSAIEEALATEKE